MSLVIAVDRDGNERIVLVGRVGSENPGEENLFEVRVTDIEGNVPTGISNPVVGPKTYQAAKDAAEKFALDNGYRLKVGKPSSES